LPAVDLYEVSLEMARLPQPTEEAPLVDYIRALFAGRDLDLVVAVGAPAARFFQKHRPQFFPSTPLLITAADQRTFSEGALSGQPSCELFTEACCHRAPGLEVGSERVQ